MIVLCCGMLRSLSTLQHNIAGLLGERASTVCGQTDVAERFEDHPATESWISNSSLSSAFHSHDGDEFEHTDRERAVEPGRAGRLRLLSVHRDVRDMLESLMRKLALRLSEGLAMLDWAVDCYWWVHQHTDEPWVLVQRYEHLLQNVPGAVAEIADFIGTRADTDGIAEIAIGCSLDRAEAVASRLCHDLVSQSVHATQSKALGGTRERLGILFAATDFPGRVALSLQDESTLLHFNHVSHHRGATGVWEFALRPEEIAVPNDRYGDWLRHARYNLSADPEDERRDCVAP